MLGLALNSFVANHSNKIDIVDNNFRKQTAELSLTCGFNVYFYLFYTIAVVCLLKAAALTTFPQKILIYKHTVKDNHLLAWLLEI